MDDKEIVCLFSGYGYQVRVVEDLDNINDDLQTALEWALAEVKKIQQAARSGKPIIKPRWPMLILRTPKVSAHISLFYRGKVLIVARAGRVQRNSMARS